MAEENEVRVSLPAPWQAWYCTECEGTFASLLEEPESCPYCGEVDSLVAVETTLTGTPEALASFSEERQATKPLDLEITPTAQGDAE